jgi:hypothetical protein
MMILMILGRVEFILHDSALASGICFSFFRFKVMNVVIN